MTISLLKRGTTAPNRWMTDRHSGLLRYCIRIWLLVQIPVFIYLSAVYVSIAYFGVSKDILRNTAAFELTVREAALKIAIGPFAETAILVILIAILRHCRISNLRIATCSGIAWGCAHGVVAVVWLPGTAWAFYMFTQAYLVRQKVSEVQGWIAAGVPHSLLNATGYGILVVDHFWL
jgi:hypothetical protein